MKAGFAFRLTPRRALTLATILLALAAWGPTVTLPLARFHGIIVLDVTQSMNVEDYLADERPQSRLDAARVALHEALQALPCGSRVGWGVFTEYRTLVLLAPLETCAHFRELSGTLDSIDGRMSWAGRSEIAKGLFWALRQADVMPARPSIVFVTDGHEAPPINPRHRPHYDGKPGTVAGLILGVGGLQPMPIPKFDPEGRRLGHWRADEVQQQDTYSQGRATSIGREKLVETEEDVGPVDWATSGNEHMSALRERYLQVVAEELKLDYLRLNGGSAGAHDLSRALGRSALAQRVPTPVSLGYPLGAVALALLAFVYAPGALRRPAPTVRAQPRTLSSRS